MALSCVENPNDKDRLLLKHQLCPPFPVWGKQRRFNVRASSKLSRAAGRARPGTLLEQLSTWCYVKTTTTTHTFSKSPVRTTKGALQYLLVVIWGFSMGELCWRHQSSRFFTHWLAIKISTKRDCRPGLATLTIGDVSRLFFSPVWSAGVMKDDCST